MSERYFDLNIEKILDGWEPRHAIRELIANALKREANLADDVESDISPGA